MLLTAPCRPADAGDVASLVRLLERCRLPHADLTLDHLPFFFAIEQAGELIGAVGLEVVGHAGLLRSLAVAAPHRRSGLGTLLVRAAEVGAACLDVETLYLLTETAAPFFSRRGYIPVARTDVAPGIRALPEFSTICPATADCLCKPLRASV